MWFRIDVCKPLKMMHAMVLNKLVVIRVILYMVVHVEPLVSFKPAQEQPDTITEHFDPLKVVSHPIIPP